MNLGYLLSGDFSFAYSLPTRIFFLMGETKAEIIRAKNGQEAISLLKERKIDVLITGIGLSGEITGIAVAKLAFELNPQMPIIICSAIEGARRDPELLKLGIKDFLIKPIQMEEFKCVFRRAITIKAMVN